MLQLAFDRTYEEELLVVLNGVVRRIAIGDLVEKHDQDDVRTWTVRDDGTAMLAPVTGFIRHRGPDYIDVLVTETGREVRVTGGQASPQYDRLNLVMLGLTVLATWPSTMSTNSTSPRPLKLRGTRTLT